MKKQFPYYSLRDKSDYLFDLRYSTPNNFTGEILYHQFDGAQAHKLTIEKLAAASKLLKKFNNDYTLLIFDALRPRAVQWKLFNFVKNTPYQSYVASPVTGSFHNFGLAVDLSIYDIRQKLSLDMGTDFDDFSDLAQPQFEEKFLVEGLLSEIQIKHRKILRNVMTESGFYSIPNEWWHFNVFNKIPISLDFPILESEEDISSSSTEA